MNELLKVSFKEGQTELIEELLPYAKQLYGETETLETVNDFICWAVETSCYHIIQYFGEHRQEPDGSIGIYWPYFPSSKE